MILTMRAAISVRSERSQRTSAVPAVSATARSANPTHNKGTKLMAKISHKQWYSNPKYRGIPYAHKQFYERFATEADAQRVLDAHADRVPHSSATWIGPGGYRWDEWRTFDIRRRAFFLEHYARFKAAKAAEYKEAEARSKRVNAGFGVALVAAPQVLETDREG